MPNDRDPVPSKSKVTNNLDSILYKAVAVDGASVQAAMDRYNNHMARLSATQQVASAQAKIEQDSPQAKQVDRTAFPEVAEMVQRAIALSKATRASVAEQLGKKAPHAKENSVKKPVVQHVDKEYTSAQSIPAVEKGKLNQVRKILEKELKHAKEQPKSKQVTSPAEPEKSAAKKPVLKPVQAAVSAVSKALANAKLDKVVPKIEKALKGILKKHPEKGEEAPGLRGPKDVAQPKKRGIVFAEGEDLTKIREIEPVKSIEERFDAAEKQQKNPLAKPASNLSGGKAQPPAYTGGNSSVLKETYASYKRAEAIRKEAAAKEHSAKVPTPTPKLTPKDRVPGMWR